MSASTWSVRPNLGSSVPSLNLSSVCRPSTIDSESLERPSGIRFAHLVLLCDLKELNSIRLERELLASPSTEIKLHAKLLLEACEEVSEVPDFTVAAPWKISPGNWRWMRSHRATVRRKLLENSQLTKDDDFVLPSLCTSQNTSVLIEYLKTCVTPVCALQAFIAITARLLNIPGMISDSACAEVGLTLASQLVHEPEVVAYIFRVFDVYRHLNSSFSLAAVALEIAASVMDIPIFSPLRRHDRKFHAAQEVRDKVILATIPAIPQKRFPFSSADFWRVIAGVGRLGQWVLNSEEVIVGFINIYSRWNRQKDESEDLTRTVSASLSCLAIYARETKFRANFRQLHVLDFVVGELDAEGEDARRSEKLRKHHDNRENLTSLGLAGSTAGGGSIAGSGSTAGSTRKVPLLRLEGLPVSMQGSSTIGAMPSEEVSRLKTEPEMSIAVYKRTRNMRRLYWVESVHVGMIDLAFSLILTVDKKIIDDKFCDLFPTLSNRLHVLYYLDKHVNNLENRPVIARYIQLDPLTRRQEHKELLKLMLDGVYRHTDWLIKEDHVLGSGAFGTVVREVSVWEGWSSRRKFIATKYSNASRVVLDRSHIQSVHNELVAMRTLQGLDVSLEVLDFGLDHNTYFLSMDYCSNSLDKWILESRPPWKLRLDIFRQILTKIVHMHNSAVIHYDLKASNLLVRCQLDSIEVMVGDFGEARVLESPKGDPPCMRNRGTEYLKSPEMITLASVVEDRRKSTGTTAASDIWSLGILLFEILTHHQLFSELDWVAFFAKLTGSHDLIGHTERALLLHCEGVNGSAYLTDRVIEYINFLLVKDPGRRPTASAALARFDAVFPETEGFSVSGGAFAGVCGKVYGEVSGQVSGEVSGAVSGEVSREASEKGTWSPRALVAEEAFFYGGITLANEAKIARFGISEDLTLVLVDDHKDSQFESSSRFVIDCRERTQASSWKGSPLQTVLYVDRISESEIKRIVSFARLAYFESERVEILDERNSRYGRGFVASLVLLRQTEGISDLTTAFLQLVNRSMISVTKVAKEAVGILQEFPIEFMLDSVGCFCGSVTFVMDKNARLISKFSDFYENSKQCAIMKCTCNEVDEICPNRDKCKIYIDWIKANFRREATAVEWLLKPGQVDKSNAMAVETPWIMTRGIKGERFKCRICGALTHVIISREEGVLCTAVCVPLLSSDGSKWSFAKKLLSS